MTVTADVGKTNVEVREKDDEVPRHPERPSTVHIDFDKKERVEEFSSRVVNQYKEENVPSGVGQQDVSNEGVQSVSEDTERKVHFGVDDTCYFGCLWRILVWRYQDISNIKEESARLIEEAKEEEIGEGLEVVESEEELKKQKDEIEKRRAEKEKRERIRRSQQN